MFENVWDILWFRFDWKNNIQSVNKIDLKLTSNFLNFILIRNMKKAYKLNLIWKDEKQYWQFDYV